MSKNDGLVLEKLSIKIKGIMQDNGMKYYHFTSAEKKLKNKGSSVLQK